MLKFPDCKANFQIAKSAELNMIKIKLAALIPGNNDLNFNINNT